jgi:hypothetical protein
MIRLAFRKRARAQRYKNMLGDVPRSSDVVRPRTTSLTGTVPSGHREAILAFAESLLRDENYFFTFPYRTRDVDRPWEFDPIEGKHWPRRHYTERTLHAHDTPRDVKIIFEINRFKDLTALGQAALLTKEIKYAAEAERRIVSWVEENPFALSVNWSSGLEIAIRLIAWCATLDLLKRAGFDVSLNPVIARSIYEQVCYLAADMGTDKVVPTNHLIGEATGVFILSSLFEFPESSLFRNSSQKILEAEMIRQTDADGVTREAASWYHQFVSHFFDMSDRIADQHMLPFSGTFKTRLSQMKAFAKSMTVNGEIVRYGDSDDGWALWMPGNLDKWKDFIFGPSSSPSADQENYFSKSEVVAAHIWDSFLFLRAGEFGMGGAGFSSHAHDDFLSPIVFLDGAAILSDPGTFLYNSDAANRVLYRRASSHNGIELADARGMFATAAVSKSDFGWKSIRPNATVRNTQFDTESAYARGSYAEWPQHVREVVVRNFSATITDTFSELNSSACEWHLHLHPQWQRTGEEQEHTFAFRNAAGRILEVELRGDFELVECESYDYSPSYRVAVVAKALRMISSQPRGTFVIALTLSEPPPFPPREKEGKI